MPYRHNEGSTLTTVAELIEKLKTMKPDMDVVLIITPDGRETVESDAGDTIAVEELDGEVVVLDV
jgi:3-deoxy-D-manno-octulosonic-acid transferase